MSHDLPSLNVWVKLGNVTYWSDGFFMSKFTVVYPNYLEYDDVLDFDTVSLQLLCFRLVLSK